MENKRIYTEEEYESLTSIHIDEISCEDEVFTI